MHATQGPSGLHYAHNEDFSGSVKVELPVLPDEHWSSDGDRASVSEPYRQAITQRRVAEAEIPFDDLKHLVLERLRWEAISKLEQADDATLEKFFGGMWQ